MSLICSVLTFCPDVIGRCIGEEAKYEGIRLLFDGLQQPVLNKQVGASAKHAAAAGAPPLLPPQSELK